MPTADGTYDATMLPEPRLGERARGHGRCVAFVGAHGGAGTTTAALAFAVEAERGVCLIDADLAGGDLMARLALSERVGDTGLAAAGESGPAAFAAASRRLPFGWFLALSPRPDLAWLIRDGAIRELAGIARENAGLVVVDVGRPLGPSCEAVVDADVVVVVGHVSQPEAMVRTRRRLQRLGVDDLRLIDCPTAPTAVERLVGRLRGERRCIDVLRGDELMLLIEGRLATVGHRGRQ